MVAGIVLSAISSVSSQPIEYETMPALVDRGTLAFSQGHYAEAASAFQKLQSVYSEEPEWQETRISEKLLPLAGYAALKAGLYDQAIASLGEFLSQENTAYSQEIFVKYTLALALEQKEQFQDALTAFEAFREATSSISQQGIAFIHEAQIHLKTENDALAIEVLKAVMQSDAASRVQTQARLRLLQEQLNQNLIEDAVQTLLGNPWHSDTMPELALMAFLAIESGDVFLKQGLNSEALRAYQLVPSRATLLEKQNQKLDQLKTVFKERKKDIGMSGVMWTDFYEQVIRSATSQLEALKASPDYSDQITLRRGRASLLSNRPFEAWLLFERLANDPTSELAGQGHLNWILAAKELGRFNAAIEIANRYLKTYPSSDSVDDALLLIASSLIDAKRFEEAIKALTELSQNAADPKYRVSSLYQRGQCLMRLTKYESARTDFDTVAQTASEESLIQRAILWNGISHFLERNHEEAITTFNDLFLKATNQELKGEALYRIACCKYSLYEYEESTKILVELSNQFPGHPREFEAQLLLGDSYFTQNRLEEAIKRYQLIPDDIPEIAHLAAIQTALAYEEAGQTEDAKRVLTRRSKITSDPYKFTEIQLIFANMQPKAGNREDARSGLEQAVAVHGNALNAENMLSALEMLIQLKEDDSSGFYEEAINQRKFRLAARLGVLKALALRADGRSFQSNEMFLELANQIPIDEFPPECLAHIGLELIKLELESGARFHEALLNKYPHSDYVPFAYYGFAKIEAESKRFGAALGWLDQIGKSDIGSPVYIDTLQLEGVVKTQLGELASAQIAFETILSLRWATSKEKAASLLSLANLKAQQGNEKQAIAYCQRVFTLYPGVTEAAAQGYLESAHYLTRIEESEKAIEVLAEFLSRDEYRHTEQFQLAKNLYTRLSHTQMDKGES